VRRAAAALAVAAALGWTSAAAAETPAEIRALAARAAHDPAALARLHAVAPRALGGARGDELAARLRALAGGSAPATGVAAPREQARAILSAPRYRGSSVPRPLHGALVWIGERLRPLARPFHWLARHVPGGAATVWTILGLLVVSLAAVVAGRIASRRGGSRLERLEVARLSSAVDPGRLEREADEAERTGDLERALRLRYRAGLLRLGRAQVIPLRESLTSGEVRQILRLREFDVLARTHDEVVFGGRTARPDDAQQARTGWPRVLEAAGARR
jgi:hypothetical protein